MLKCFRPKCLWEEILYILKEGVAGPIGQHYERDPSIAGEFIENA